MIIYMATDQWHIFIDGLSVADSEGGGGVRNMF